MIVVTGASGYLGSHIVRRLAQADQSVRAMVHNVERARKETRLDGLSVDWVQLVFS